jgi:hypothetical protein
LSSSKTGAFPVAARSVICAPSTGNCSTSSDPTAVVAGDVRCEGAVVQCDDCGKDTETAYGDPDGESLGPVLNPDGSPSDVTLAMLTGQGR